MATALKKTAEPEAEIIIRRGPRKGCKPNFDGVSSAFAKLSEVPPSVIFGVRKAHVSPYDQKLNELLEKGKDAVLVFDDVRARASLSVRSRKLGLKIEYGEYLGKLYVRMLPSAAALNENPAPKSLGTTVAESDKTRKRSLILTAIRMGKHTPEAIAVFMRQEGGASQIDAPVVRSMLKHMQTDGSVRLVNISPEKWELAA